MHTFVHTHLHIFNSSKLTHDGSSDRGSSSSSEAAFDFVLEITLHMKHTQISVNYSLW